MKRWNWFNLTPKMAKRGKMLKFLNCNRLNKVRRSVNGKFLKFRLLDDLWGILQLRYKLSGWRSTEKKFYMLQSHLEIMWKKSSRSLAHIYGHFAHGFYINHTLMFVNVMQLWISHGIQHRFAVLLRLMFYKTIHKLHNFRTTFSIKIFPSLSHANISGKNFLCEYRNNVCD